MSRSSSAFCVMFAAAATFGAAPTTELKSLVPPGLRIGAALNQAQSDGKDAAAVAIVLRQFNSISPENLLKWESVHPGPDRFDFEPADRYVEFGRTQGMFVVGHVLLWHQQTPPWVFAGEGGKKADRETLLARLQSHITTVVGRYRGKIGGWDVVNEALDEDGTLRRTPWLEAIGEDYIAKAFEFAHAADPDAELYYNDYNLWKPAKRDAAVRLVQGLKAKGLRVDGIGEQGHWGIDEPPLDGDRRGARRHPRVRHEGAHHGAGHRRPAPRPRHVGSGPLEAVEDPRRHQHLPERPAGGDAGAARAPLRGSVHAVPEARRRTRDLLGRHRRHVVAAQLPDPRAGQLPAALGPGRP